MSDIVERNSRKLTGIEMAEYKGPMHYIPHHGVMLSLLKSITNIIQFACFIYGA